MKYVVAFGVVLLSACRPNREAQELLRANAFDVYGYRTRPMV